MSGNYSDPELRNNIPELDPLHNAVMRKKILDKLFQKISTADYTVLWLLYQYAKNIGSEKIYLKDIAEQLSLPMDQVSKLAGKLQSKGFVHWTHDGSGEEGTYLQFTADSFESAMSQKKFLSDYTQRVIKSYGEPQFIDLLGELTRLEDIMRIEAEKAGDTDEKS